MLGARYDDFKEAKEILKKIDHISINAKNTKALAKWYQDVLGFEIILEMKKEGRPPVYFIKLKGDSFIEVQDSPWNPHLCFEVKDFWKTVKNLVSKGVTLKIVRKTSIGWTAGFFEDPEGNLIEILYRPKPIPKEFKSFEKKESIRFATM
jgi:catechol 2,3-dioxygenase-like lactoylglutathione lyase family enzyme